jgi:hypothetical protein
MEWARKEKKLGEEGRKRKEQKRKKRPPFVTKIGGV